MGHRITEDVKGVLTLEKKKQEIVLSNNLDLGVPI